MHVTPGPGSDMTAQAMDAPAREEYLLPMKRPSRILPVLLLAAFAAMAIAGTATATAMSLQMAMVADTGGVVDCDSRPEPGGTEAVCAKACTPSLTALPVSGPADLARTPALARQMIPQAIAGRAPPPERHPPR